MRSDFQCCGFLPRMWHPLGPLSPACPRRFAKRNPPCGWSPAILPRLACHRRLPDQGIPLGWSCIFPLLAYHTFTWVCTLHALSSLWTDFYSVLSASHSESQNLSKWHIFMNLSSLKSTNQSLQPSFLLTCHTKLQFIHSCLGLPGTALASGNISCISFLYFHHKI